MMFINAIFAFYSYIELGLPDVGSSAPSAYSGRPVWFDVQRARAEQLLVEVLATLRSGAPRGPGGRTHASDERYCINFA